MRRANPRQIGSICRHCTSTPLRTTNRPSIAQLAALPSQQLPRTSSIPPYSGKTRTFASASVTGSPEAGASSTITTPAKSSHGVPDPAELAALVEDSRNKFLSVDGIPAKQLTTAALQSCLRAATELQPLLKRSQAQANASASRLVALGAERTGVKNSVDGPLNEAVNRISYSAYTIIKHPNVEMTPEFLELYVRIQSHLGRPESLPSVFELFAHKPKPVVKNGEITYVPQNPHAAMKAIEVPTTELALHTAIQAKNLDASLGIVEASYCVPAFRRQKLIKHGTTPGIGLASLPFGIFGLSTAYAAYWQNTMDMSTATGIGFAGISGYFLVVGSMGLIAKLSNKDQMRRVTWTPGTPLRYRWMREEERAALDKIACAWGFKEPWRHGEETGPEWEGLKEYLGYRGMLLDRVEFMQGMG
ncbi:hypothetical protein HJFPF1_01017 [Paramyrothecium foliicola]|nr:hypothetical protein HJFPF1_01017 [Paramyrothecium foliicola]